MTDAPERRWFSFSLRRLAASITLFAVSFGAWTAMLNLPNEWSSLAAAFALVLIGCMSFCAAIGVLFRNWDTGLQIAIAIGFGAGLFIILGGLERLVELFR